MYKNTCSIYKYGWKMKPPANSILWRTHQNTSHRTCRNETSSVHHWWDASAYKICSETMWFNPWHIMSVFRLHFSRKINVDIIILRESVDTAAILFVLVAKPRKLRFCGLDYRLASEVLGLSLSVCVTSHQRMLYCCVNQEWQWRHTLFTILSKTLTCTYHLS